MLTSDERREVADKFRRDAAIGDKLKAKGLDMIVNLTDAPSYLQDIAMFIGVRGGTVKWTGFERHLADLIDPTCHAVHSETAMEDELVCSECGSSLGIVLRDGRTLLPHFCACCGARTTRGDTDERS